MVEPDTPPNPAINTPRPIVHQFKDAGAILRHRPFLGLRFIFSVIRITAEAMIVPGGNRKGTLNGVGVADNSGLQQQYTLSLGLDF